MEKQATRVKELFLYSRDVVVGVEKGRIVFMNPAAERAAGRDMTGDSAALALPEHILSLTGDCFVSTGSLFGHSAAISCVRYGDMTVYSSDITPASAEETLFAAGEPASRVVLANLKLAAGRLALLAETREDAVLMGYASQVNHAYYQMKRLMLNSSVLAAICRGGLQCDIQDTDMTALCEGVVENSAFFAERLGVDITFQSPEGRCGAMVDPSLTEQLLLNLISNSLAHTQKGGHINVRLVVGGKYLTIFVDDNGAGIPAEVMATVFARWKEQSDIDAAALGAGAGLSVARGIAEAQGGALVLESQEGRGTAVRVLLPRNEYSALLREGEEEYKTEMTMTMAMLSKVLPASEYSSRLED